MTSPASIEDLRETFAVETDDALAKALGIGRSTVTSWRRRGKVPERYGRLATVSEPAAFGEKLRLLRGERSQEKFAGFLGITRAALANYETGRTCPHSSQQDRLLIIAAGGPDSADDLRAEILSSVSENFERQMNSLFEKHCAHSYDELAAKIGVSRSAVGNWVNRRSIPERYLKAPHASAQPWQLPAALAVLRDGQMTDAEARKVALTFLQQLEGAHT